MKKRETLTELEKEAVDFFSQLGKTYGLKDISLRIFAILYIEPKEIALEDIALKTGYSKASVSNSAKMLEMVGCIKRIKHPGSRKVYFFAEKSLFKLNINKLNSVKQNFLKAMKARLNPVLEKYKNKDLDENSKQKLKILVNYNSQLAKFEKVINKWINDLEEVEYNAGKF